MWLPNLGTGYKLGFQPFNTLKQNSRVFFCVVYIGQYRYDEYLSAKNVFNKQCEASDSGLKPLYRPWFWNRLQRDQDKSQKRDNWFKTGGYENKFFIPATENGALKRKLEDRVKHINVNLKVKFIEQPGATIVEAMREMLSISDKSPCDDQNNCMQCKTEDAGNCRKSLETPWG